MVSRASKMAQKRVIELSKHETDVLLGLYSGCECLWNKKSSEYKDQPVRNGAYRTIIHGMRLETGKEFTLGQVEMALHKIQAVYSQELKRVLDGEKDSASKPYTSPWRWFQFLDSFLRDQILRSQDPKSSSSKNTLQDSSTKQQAKATEGGDTSGTDDYSGTLADSGDEGANGTGFGTSGPSRDQTPAATTVSSPARSTRPVRSSRLRARAVFNGVGLSEDDDDEDWDPLATSKKRKVSHSRTVSSEASNRVTPPSVHSRQPSKQGAGLSDRQVSNVRDSGQVSKQMADTLKAIQTLLATTLSNQDQPAMVFARHIANELEQISDYGQRKQCMLDIQQVIMGYQKVGGSNVGARVKPESSRGGEEEGVSERGVFEQGGRALPTVELEEPLVLHFDSNIA